MTPKYKNIPVKPEVYERVALLAEASGLGERGLGAQVAQWAARSLPECDHKKQPVEIEYFAGLDLAPGEKLFRHGLYCSTCQRVYALTTIS